MSNALVLVGMENRAEAIKFLATISENLRQHGVRVTLSDKVPMTLETPHAQIRFIYDRESLQKLSGLSADVVFGLDEYVKPLYAHLKPHHPTKPGIGLLEWIVKYEDSCTQHDCYIRQDISNTQLAVALNRAAGAIRKAWFAPKIPEIKCVHFSGPCTVVIWNDDSKTIVRCGENDVMDPEKGLAMAIAKKVLGTNKTGSNYYSVFKKWLPKPEEAEGNE
ncbi:MAG: hypothetical protein IKZ08_02480 [Bacteroidales bacterium]|nr:hypothetical protein [Bacteroidales bacterium]